ncbi:uncharacterized protein LOC123314195 [Coccinella septempunctata]|uniref:uncharacterized protein LOC123314195 n=1 Tax=Coccinella septempunctata TaxID=41139 RepID=UPI001D08ECF1|nr:uncharacterized protein LOC123314195 [Coccinella septempunctata]
MLWTCNSLLLETICHSCLSKPKIFSPTNMKDFSILCLTIATVCIQYISARTIEDELKDFCDIMPNEQMKKIAEAHIKTDKEFNEAIIFLQSTAWASLIRDVQQNSEWKKLKRRLNDTGLNIDAMLKSFFSIITDLKPIPNTRKTRRSLRAFFDDIELVLPIGKLLAMLHEKKQNSTVFQEFYNKISSEEVHKMFESVRKQPEMKRIIIELKSMGARVDDMLELFYGFMNWDSPSRVTRRDSSNTSLKEDFEDFKRLIPWEKLRNISDEHLANDKEFGEVVTYFQGPEFARIVNAIKIRPEYIELKTYLEDAGIDIEGIIKFLSDLIMSAKPGCKTKVENAETRKIRSFRTYLDEIEGAIPVGKLLAVFNDKMEHSEEFKKFIKKISEPKVKKMVEDIRELKESRELFEKLQGLGVRVRETFIIIYAFLGWGSPFEKTKDIVS